ncbi:STAS domain-containing protein [Akkermansiaceae bacterium]|nr:STAS domain-containing protein [Akkermansiaceae bacterium]
MKINSTISVGRIKELGWIRCVAKGNFNNSPSIEAWATSQLTNGLKEIVVDLEKCTGMDSTFMGNLAGLAVKLMEHGSRLQIVDASNKCIDSLNDLGISSLMELNPKEDAHEWIKAKDCIRKSLVELHVQNDEKKAIHVYEAHKKLSELDEQNADRFQDVLACLESSIECEKRADTKK